MASSLSATTCGFAFYDIVRLFTGGIPWFDSATDRGLLLEKQWAHIAAAKAVTGNPLFGCETDKILGLRQAIKQGNIPAPIFNTTAMESGRRIMITPINFDTQAWATQEGRGDTLTELLFKVARVGPKAQNYREVDLDLWTAARLSAAFPYVTPAARAKFRPGAAQEQTGLDKDYQQYHLIDGGYYDNFGIASALDWLEPVLQARYQGERDHEDNGLEFTRVALIELRAFPVPFRNCYQSEQGAASAIIGPTIGLYNIRTGSAFSRNEIEISRFKESWANRLANVKIERFVFQPPLLSSVTECGEEKEIGPLSWHLTQREINNLNKQWQESANQSELVRLKEFLGQNNPPNQ